jgi:hypothetical protein
VHSTAPEDHLPDFIVAPGNEKGNAKYACLYVLIRNKKILYKKKKNAMVV